jgi:hypothetical protein
MRKFVLLFVLGIMFLFPFSTSAQTDVSLYSVNVQLWPEYDQPSMLVIVDFKLAPMTSLPMDLTFRIPKDANLIAVAYQDESGDLLNAKFEAPTEGENWQTFTMTIENNVIHRFEYYQPLMFKGNERSFSYSWNQIYAVKKFSVNVLEPMDVVAFSMQPDYAVKEIVNGLTIYASEEVKVDEREQYKLDLQYEKTSLNLINPPQQQVQPAGTLDESTPGRVSLNNFLPYVIGGFGLLFIVVGAVYYWRIGRTSTKRARRRRNVEDDESKTGTYCASCGTRAKTGDKFCRTCGAKL